MGNEADVVSLKSLANSLPAVQQLRRAGERELIDAMHLRLQQVLSFLDENDVDICVFPEYAFPCDSETLNLLRGFSQRMTIVAGLGIPRSAGLETLSQFSSDPVEVSNNVVVVFGGSACHIVTKRHAATNERIDSGTGPRLLTIQTRRGEAKLAVAICKDYLVEGTSGSNFDQIPDVLAVPAYTDRATPFEPDAPRDFPRIFANAAKAGGSTIFASGCEGVFVREKTVAALPPLAEGLIAVDWFGPSEQPTPLLKPRNGVHLRSALITKSDGASAKDIIDGMRSLVLSSDPVPTSVETIPRWIRYLEDIPSLAILRDSVATFRDAIGDDVLSQDLARVLSSHVISLDSPSLAEMKRDQLATVASTLDRAIGPGLLDPSAYKQVLKAAESYADWRPGTGEGGRASEPGDSEISLHFQIGFGRFDVEDALATIPGQEDLLSAFFLAAPAGAHLSFVLKTSEDPASGFVSAQFFLRFFGTNDADSRAYFKSLEPIARSVFVRGWSLYTPRAIDIDGVCTEIHPRGSRPQDGASREDLGLLVDALAASGGGLALEMIAAPPSSAQNDETQDSIEIAVRLHTPEPNWALSHLVGSTIFPEGWEATQIDPAASPTMATVARSDALKILHPPDGHIAGRGLPRQRRLELPAAADVEFLGQGATLGRAVVQHAASDRAIDVRIPDSSRTLHTYIIGRTGSGKTNTLKNVVRHDLSRDNGVVVIDPHGDLFDYALRHAVGRRDFVSLDFSGDHVPSVNPIYLDAVDEAGVMRNIDDLVEAMVHSTYHQFAGPRFRDIARLCLETLVAVADESAGRFASLADVPPLIEDRHYRESQISLLTRVGRDDLSRRWEAHQRMQLSEQAEVEQWFVSKFSDFRRSTKFQKAVSGKPDVSLDATLKDHSALLIRVPTTGLGVGPSKFLGSLIVERVLRYTMEHGFNESTSPASLIVDEFQTFVGTSFVQLIPEARKFNLAVTIANQTLSQLTSFSSHEGARSAEMEHAILGNVGNLVVQSVGHSDADRFAQELGLSVRDVMRVGRHSAIVTLTVRGTRSDAFTVDLADASERPGVVSEATLASAIDASVSRAASLVVIPPIERLDPGADETQTGAQAPEPSPNRRTDFLDEWLAKRREILNEGGSSSDGEISQKRPSKDGKKQNDSD